MLGAAAQATDHIPLMTYVTCPIRRYHPAVVAQKAATMQLLSDGRFTLGLGAGENLNEHIVGGRWPIAGVRHEMLEEAVEIIRALWAGGTVTYRGKHFDVESAKVWDLPDVAPPIGIAVSGPGSCRLAGRHADAMIAVEPRAELGEMFDDAGGAGKPRIGQIALSYDPDQQTAVKRAMDQFRWFTGGWRVNAELPVPASFDAASKTVREEDVSAQMPCGPDVAAARRRDPRVRERPGSPTSRWCKSAGTPKSNSSAGRQPNCCPRSELVDEARRLSRAFRHGGHGRTRAWAPLRREPFPALWIAEFVSNVGTWMQSVGAVWVMVDLKASPTEIALVQTATTLPVVFFGIIGGALADLVDRRRVLLVTQTIMLVAAWALRAA